MRALALISNSASFSPSSSDSLACICARSAWRSSPLSGVRRSWLIALIDPPVAGYEDVAGGDGEVERDRERDPEGVAFHAAVEAHVLVFTAGEPVDCGTKPFHFDTTPGYLRARSFAPSVHLNGQCG